jgi:hypothetical protein
LPTSINPLRKANLARLLARRPDGIFMSDFEQGEIGPDLFRKACEFGFEGLVSKHRDRTGRGWLPLLTIQTSHCLAGLLITTSLIIGEATSKIGIRFSLQVVQYRVAGIFGLRKSLEWRAGDPDGADVPIERAP